MTVAPPVPGSSAGDWTEVVPYADVVTRSAASWPDAVAVDLPGTCLTYAELDASVAETAESLLALGVGPRDHVGVLLPNGADYLRFTFAIAALGAVGVLVNARFQGDDLAHVLADAGLKVVLTGSAGSDVRDEVDLASRLATVLPAPDVLPRLEAVVVLGEVPQGLAADPRTVRGDTLAAQYDGTRREEVDRLRRQVSVRDVAMMMYTSGTTARPKGCLLSHEMIVRNGGEVARRLGVAQGDRFWDPLPMFHLSSVLPMIGCFTRGARFVTMGHFDAGYALAEMARVSPTHLYPAFPTVIQALAQHPDFGSADFSQVRVVNCIGPAETLRSLQAQWPSARLISAYGCTEVGGVIAHGQPTDDLDDRVRTCGPPFTGIQVRVVDPATGEVLPVGDRGELCVRGWSLFEGYHRAPELTAERTDTEGWFRTGDIGSLDAEGRVSYHGRLKDMLKVGGENVAALEVEECLQSHLAVSIAQVVSVPDPRLMEVPAAFVELRPDQEVSPDDLTGWVRSHLASFKVPRHVRIVTQWPMAATKIQKFKLRAQLCEELGIPVDD